MVHVPHLSRVGRLLPSSETRRLVALLRLDCYPSNGLPPTPVLGPYGVCLMLTVNTVSTTRTVATDGTVTITAHQESLGFTYRISPPDSDGYSEVETTGLGPSDVFVHRVSAGGVALLEEMLSIGLRGHAVHSTLRQVKNRVSTKPIVAALLEMGVPIIMNATMNTFALFSDLVDALGMETASKVMRTATMRESQEAIMGRVRRRQHLISQATTESGAVLLLSLPSSSTGGVRMVLELVNMIEDEAEWEDVRKTQWFMFSGQDSDLKLMLRGRWDSDEWDEVLSLFLYLFDEPPLREAFKVLKAFTPEGTDFTPEQLLACALFAAQGMGESCTLALGFFDVA